MPKRLLTPFQKFIKIEGLSGVLLLGATLLALIWANSPYGESYRGVWQFQIGVSSSQFTLVKPLLLWINDGLMAVFFFLIGLEIKREIAIGELNSIKKLAFPLFGAIGGALVPVGIYLLFNTNPETHQGWGIPMATDIAFSLAVLNTLGKRVPLSLKVFLIAFAIVDDIEAVLVIAIFYSKAINSVLLLIGLLLIAALYFLSYRKLYSQGFTLFVGIVVWILFLKSGVHPTVAGILLAFSIPIRQKVKTATFLQELLPIVDRIKNASVIKKPILSKEQIESMDHLEDWSKQFRSPLQHLEHLLHGPVAYFIIPLFALANAGVVLGGTDAADTDLILTIILALVVGKGFGIPLVVYAAQGMGIIQIPVDIRPMQVIGVSFIAGIGFTMAIFIASLAFEGQETYIASAKMGILLGSFISAIIGYVILRWSPNRQHLRE